MSPAAPIIPVQLTGVPKRYGTTTAVAGLDLEVQPAEVLRYARLCRVERVMLPYLEAIQ